MSKIVMAIEDGKTIPMPAGQLAVDEAGSLLNKTPIYRHTVSSGDITAKGFAVGVAPYNRQKVVLTVLGAPPQNYGIDWTIDVSGNVSWSIVGSSMLAALVAGDLIEVIYLPND